MVQGSIISFLLFAYKCKGSKSHSSQGF